MSPKPDTLAGKVLGDLRSEIDQGLSGFTSRTPFEGEVELPVEARGAGFDYVVVGYHEALGELRRRLFELRAAMIGHTATFELRPADEGQSPLQLSPRQIAGGEETASLLNGPMQAVGLHLDLGTGRGIAYGDLTENAARRKGTPRLQAPFSMTNFELHAQPTSSTTRAVTAYDFAHTMVGHVVDLSRSAAPVNIEQPHSDVAGVA